MKHRTAVIGLGAMGRRHLQAINLTPGLKLVAACDQRSEHLVHSVLGDVKAYTDWRNLLEIERPELVVISTHGSTHAPIAMAAAQAEAKVVLCEKPMATSLVAAREMMQICASTRTQLLINHTRRGIPVYRELASLIQGPLLGGLASIYWGMDGGKMACNGTHLFDISMLLSGQQLTGIRARLNPAPPPNPRGREFFDPGGQATITLSGGGRLIVDMFEDIGGPHLCVIMCRKGRVVLNEIEARVEVIARDPEFVPEPGRWPAFIEIPFDWPFDQRLDLVKWMRRIYAQIVEGETAGLEAEHGYRSLEAYIACVLSDRQGESLIQLPLIQPEELDLDVPIT